MTGIAVQFEEVCESQLRWRRLAQLLAETGRVLAVSDVDGIAPYARGAGQNFLKQWSRFAQEGAQRAERIGRQLGEAEAVYREDDEEQAARIRRPGFETQTSCAPEPPAKGFAR